MTEPRQDNARLAALKVSYLVAVTVVVFALPAVSLARPFRWFVIPVLIGIQLLILLVCHVGVAEIVRPAWRLKWLFAFLLVMYALLPSESPLETGMLVDWPVPGIGWSVRINLSGLEQAGLMCLQIVTVLLASGVVRLTGTGHDLVDGLHAFRLPALFVHSLDRTLELLAGTEKGGGRGRRKRSSGGGLFAILKQLMRGDFRAFTETIQTNMVRAENHSERNDDRLAHDVAAVTGIALCMASLKMVKILPGLPFASGYKTLLLFPLYVLAARLTHSRWGATAAGSIMGIVGFLQGDGRFGALEILKHVAPGLVIDLGEPLVRRLPPWAFGYCVLGFFAAIARTATEFLVVLALGARAEVYLFPAVKLVPNLVAGVLSGFVTPLVLRALARPSTSARKPDPLMEAGDASRSMGSPELRENGPGGASLEGSAPLPGHRSPLPGSARGSGLRGGRRGSGVKNGSD